MVEDPTTEAAPAPRRRAIVGLMIPTGLFALGLALLVTGRVSSLDLALCAGMYAVTMVGITMGYHRHFTHSSFRAHPALRTVLGAMGAMAAQGPVGIWASVHRKHHQWSDRPQDPHSPHQTDSTLAGLWHAHVGWITGFDPEGWERNVPDLLKDPVVQRLDRWYPYLILFGFVAPALLGGVIGGSGWAALTGFLWGGPIRLFLGFNGTWLINSISHVFGSRPYLTHDRSTNNALCAILTFGEGWHNNHHAFPASARHGLAWWQLDPTYWLIALCHRLGLASHVVLPDAQALAAKRRGVEEAA